MILLERDSDPYVVAWFAHSDHWVSIAQCPNPDDARMVCDAMNAALPLGSTERYIMCRRSAFAEVITR